MKAGISLREVREGDLATFFAHQLEPEATEMAAFPSRGCDEFMAHWQKSLVNPTCLLRTVTVHGEVAGNLVLWEQEGENQIGYWFGIEYWGKGIATTALSQFLNIVKARPLIACVAELNFASIRVLEKCSFTIFEEENDEFIMRLEASPHDDSEQMEHLV